MTSDDIKILTYAQDMGELANFAEKIAVRGDETIYALSLNDSDGMPIPIGLPRLVIDKGGNLSIIRGKEAFAILDSLDLDDKGEINL